ncbi:MAG: hypothetical protein ABI459_11550 [Deltaproteobacteria bacterium]
MLTYLRKKSQVTDVPQTSLAQLSEVFGALATDGAATGFVMAHLFPKARAPVLWVRDFRTGREAGRPYQADLPGGVLFVDLSHPRDVLMAMEDGLRCPGLAGVVGEIWGDPKVLDFTATKRLALRSEGAKIPCWLIRRGAEPSLSAARDRWKLTSLPSAAHPDDPRAPGQPRWLAELFRSRDKRPGTWVVSHDRTTHHLDFTARLRDGALAETGRTDGRSASG